MGSGERYPGTFLKVSAGLCLGVWIAISVVSCASLEVRTWDFSPQGPGTVTVAQISDLHISDRAQRYTMAARRILEAKPDVLVLTGDAIESPGHLDDLAWFLDMFSSLERKAAILGNHEYWSGEDLEALGEVYRSRGWELLINRRMEWNIGGRPVVLWGVDDFLSGRPEWEIPREAQPDPLRASLVLIHEPEMFTRILQKNPGLKGGLFLAGHTHGGQVTLFGWPPVLPRGSGEFVDGHYVRSGSSLLVSRGLGYSGLPLRFWADFDLLLVKI